jgi:7tm Odorant receptor
MNVELFKPFKLIFSVFKVTGMWQDGNQSWTYFILGYFAHFLFFELCLLGELLYVFNTENLEDLVEGIGMTFTYISAIFRCWNFFYKLKLIKNSVDTLTALLEFSADERWKFRDHVKSQVAFGLKVYKAFWVSAYITCIFSSLVPFISHQLPYKVWFPFDTENSEIGFWIASTFLICNAFTVSVVDISLDTLPVIFLTFSIGLTNELSERLSEIGRSDNKVRGSNDQQDLNSKSVSIENVEMTKELIKCIEIHKKIKEFVNEIQENFSTVILIQGFFSALILCTGAFSMSTVKK